MTDQAEKRGHLNGKQRQLRVEIEEIASIAGWTIGTSSIMTKKSGVASEN
jgi:hypothetical protein